MDLLKQYAAGTLGVQHLPSQILRGPGTEDIGIHNLLEACNLVERRSFFRASD
ncbi:hypothetical protein [Pseudomonas chlororaphis]|uniref:hypothetical protein n=1 Tax=Pseudomonas chlororaphis TaxID=587753 RepID=UPI000B306D2B|nr:hypothetical protein [Pseudomonas chlororaphis]